MQVVPGCAPMIRPTWSPTVSGMSHQPSPHERMPRVFHMRAYSSEAVLGGGRHRRQRVVDQVGGVREDREAVAESGGHRRRLDGGDESAGAHRGAEPGTRARLGVDVLPLLERLVSIDSVNPGLGGRGEEEIAMFVAEWARGAGLEVEFDEAAPGRPNVIATARGSGGGRRCS